MHRRIFLAGAAAASAALFIERAGAAGSTLKLIYPYAPGGGGDLVVRMLTDPMQASLKVPVIVENRTGADGRIAVRDVARAAPDGDTLLFTPFGAMVLFPTAFKDLPYDAFKGFAAVTQVATFDFALAVGANSEAKSLRDLVDWLKKNPNKNNVAVPARGALPHLLPVKFAQDAGVKINAVVYKGPTPAATAAMSDEVTMVCDPLADLLPQHRAGTLRILGIFDKKRSPYLPEVPTVEEQGYNVAGSGWYGVFAPAATPPDVIAKLNKALVEAIHSAPFQERAKSLYLRATGTTPEELRAIQMADYERWKPVIEAAGLADK